jgi:Response regulator containing CheY-like receiver domain and AraC-type DNA-binding domain
MKAKEKDKIKHSLTLKWLTSYLLVFVVPLIFYLFFSISSSVQVYKSVSYANSTALQSLRYQLDSGLSQSDSFAEAVLLDTTFNSLSSSTSVSELDSMYLLSTVLELRHLVNNYNQIEEAFLFFPSNGSYVSTERWGTSRDFYLRNELSLSLSESDTEALLRDADGRLTIRDVSIADYKGKRIQRILITRPLSYVRSMYGNPLFVGVLLDVSSILPSNAAFNNFFIISNADGNLIMDYSAADTGRLGAKDVAGLSDGESRLISGVMATAGDSSVFNVKFVSLMSQGEFFADVYKILLVAVAYFILSIVLGSSLMRRQIKKEWSSFSEAISQSGASVDETIENAYSPFVSSVSELKKETESMGLVIKEQTESLKENMLSKLVERGNVPVSEKALGESGIHFISDHFLIFLAQLKEGWEAESSYALAEENFSSSEVKILRFPSSYGLSFIVNLSSVLVVEGFYQKLALLAKKAVADERYGIEYAAASDLVEGVKSLGSAYLDAINVMEYLADVHSREFLFYRDVEGMTSQLNFTYTTENEITLQQCILDGDSIRAEKLVDSIVSLNRGNGVSPRCLRYLLFSIASTVIRTVNMLKDRYEWTLPEVVFSPIVQGENYNASLSEINEILIKICDAVRLIKNQNSNASDESYVVYQKALREIHNSYSDQMLNVSELASRLGVSMVYLSKCFKKYHGENISDYIALYRVMMAKKMLADGAMISEVVESCGFGSTRTFLRVFKNLEHITPGQYKAIRKEDYNE